MRYDEENMVQRPTHEELQDLGWEAVDAYADREGYGRDSLLGRGADSEVVLVRYLRAALEKLNPDLPAQAYENAVRQLTADAASQDLVDANREQYALIRDGVRVSYKNDDDAVEHKHLNVIDFANPANNHFLCVREFTVRRTPHCRRADLVGFVNGLPLLFVECKNVSESPRAAYDKNFVTYRREIPHLFYHNAIVMVGNGITAKIGSITSEWAHFHEWKRLDEGEPGVVDMQTLLRGVCTPAKFLDLVENFILFDSSAGAPRKIIARNHQYFGVSRAIENVRNRENLDGKLGVFWHTQGAGKSYSMVFFARKVLRHLQGQFTFLVLTDRRDLNDQIRKTFAGCGEVGEADACNATSGAHLQELLGQHKNYVFSLIQKFNRRNAKPYTAGEREVIVISDEAHRTQHGTYASQMRKALPKAHFIGFTGTPLFTHDQITKRVFGEYVSTYDFKRAVDDGATVPLYYEVGGDKLKVADDVNKRVAKVLEKLDFDEADVDKKAALEKELQRDYHIYTASKRLEQVAREFVAHYTKDWERGGKAMLVCIDKVTCGRMHQYIEQYWQEHIAELESQLPATTDKEESERLAEQIVWMQDTQIALVVSESMDEAARFANYGLDITPHRQIINNGMELPVAMRAQPQYAHMPRLSVEEAFKAGDHPFRVAIVCAMWLTGFDVPSLSNIYLDKPLKAHTLMQAIARANRVYKEKTNGVVVDFCGILDNLHRALATYTNADGTKAKGVNPTRPIAELLAELKEAIRLVREFLAEYDAPFDRIDTTVGFDRNGVIADCKDAINTNDETRKEFEVLAREVFRKFKACIYCKGLHVYQCDYTAISIVYKSLQADRDRVDISEILKQLQAVVDGAIDAVPPGNPDDPKVIREDHKPLDLSQIDFEKLRRQYPQKAGGKLRTTVQNMKDELEKRLRRLLDRNPARYEDLQTRYNAIVKAYNAAKDAANVETAFAELLRLTKDLNAEQESALAVGLGEEELAVYDLLVAKRDLTDSEIEKIKEIAPELLASLKAGALDADHWRDSEGTRDDVWRVIHNHLWKHLPFPKSEGEEKFEQYILHHTERVYQHIYRVYPTPEPSYAA